jgi:ribonuclease HI
VKATLYIDGASRGNPGPAAIGAVAYDEAGTKLFEISEAIGDATNNAAEYAALIAGMGAALAQGVKHLVVKSDSQLLVRQMKGEYKVKSASLRPTISTARLVAARFTLIEFIEIPRSENSEADKLANLAFAASGNDQLTFP